MLFLELDLRLPSSVCGQRYTSQLLHYNSAVLGLLGCIWLIIAITDLRLFYCSEARHLGTDLGARRCLLLEQIDHELCRVARRLFICPDLKLNQVVGGADVHQTLIDRLAGSVTRRLRVLEVVTLCCRCSLAQQRDIAGASISQCCSNKRLWILVSSNHVG